MLLFLKYNISGVVRNIDGSYVKIFPLREHPNSCCNRKGFHSVLLQGVCDHQKLFIDAYAGEPGSIHDNRLVEKSRLHQKIVSKEIKFSNNSHLIGDLAYSLQTTMMVGFKDNGYLTPQQKMFNLRLSQTRSRESGAK